MFSSRVTRFRILVRWWFVLVILLMSVLLFFQQRVRAQTAVPLPELGTDFYLGEQGGLYPNGLNIPPDAYHAQLEVMASQLAQEKEVVVLGLGMSMMQNAMRGFEPYANGPEINPALTVINGATGSNQQRWQDPNNAVWDRGVVALAAAGLAPEDVDIVLYHNAWSGPTLPFPEHSLVVKDSFALTIDTISQKYPNVQLIFLNSRHYGGWNPDSKIPEPWSYEEGWAVKWLIEERINGEIDTPLLAWMAYQWIPTWPESYFVADGLHLSPEGQVASGALWDDFFRTSSYSAPWYLDGLSPTPAANPTVTSTLLPTAISSAVPTATSSATILPTETATSTSTATIIATQTSTSTVTATALPTETTSPTLPPTNTPTPGAGGTFTFNPVADAVVLSNRATANYGTIGSLGTDDVPVLASYLRFDVQELNGSVNSATLRIYLDSGNSTFAAAEVADNSWAENSITYSNAPALGSVINNSGAVSAGSFVEIDVTAYINGNGTISLAVIADENGRNIFNSREGFNPPELLIVTN